MSTATIVAIIRFLFENLELLFFEAIRTSVFYETNATTPIKKGETFMFPFLTAFMIFIVVIALLRARTTRREKERSDAFWARENEANSARKVDLSTITYFSYDPSQIPEPPEKNEELLSLREAITAAAKKQMLNLNGISNTDLKLTYGPQNLDELTIYGDNYSALENAIFHYGTALHEEGYLAEAIRVLEKGIALPTDLTQNYLKLADYYEEAGTPGKLPDLAALAEKNLVGFGRDAVLSRLTPKETTDKAP